MGAVLVWAAPSWRSPLLLGGHVDTIAVLIPSADDDSSTVDPRYAEELKSCSAVDLFYPVLYNERTFVANKPAPVKSMDALRRGIDFNRDRRPGSFRCHRNDEEEAARHAFKRQGYRLVFSDLHSIRPYGPKDGFSPCRHLPTHMPSYGEILFDSWREPRWMPESFTYDVIMASIMKGTGFEKTSDTPGGLAHIGADIIEWRVFYYEQRVVYAAPNSSSPMAPLFPSPLEDFAGKPLVTTEFTAIDLVLDTEGAWWVIGVRPGETAAIPKGGNAGEFYRRLAEEIRRGPNMPSWCWGLAAEVIDSHVIGNRKVTVPGTLNFAPHTKVWIIDGYWGTGGERLTVLGFPKYCSHLIAVSMARDLLRNYRLERVEDPVVLRALLTGRADERFERERKIAARRKLGMP